MTLVLLYRTESSDKGTFGRMTLDGVELCLTVERPWKNNEHQVSCIPPGLYDCIPHSSEKFPNVWEVTGVPNRDAILIHNGNTMLDVIGCIAVGNERGRVSGLPAVLNSKLTLQHLRNELPRKFQLQVINDYEDRLVEVSKR